MIILGILLVLGALLFPSFSKARERVRTAKGLSNLRQLGLGIIAYTSDYDDTFPIGLTETNATGADWAILVEAHMSGKTNANYGTLLGRTTLVTTSPNASIKGGRLHYSAHPRLMPDITGIFDPTPYPEYRASQIKRPGEIILLMDGVQCCGTNNADSDATAWQIAEADTVYSEGASDNNDPIAFNDINNSDQPSNQAYIRWRQRSGSAANFLFVDGHVATLTTNELLKRNVRAD